jgi:NAD(P)-dependent dehydrogenase (short-subunit alcohol dehydrogenase family)
MRLADKVAIVTGAAGAGIGQVTARALAREGASVVISDAHAKRPFLVAKEIMETSGVKTLGIQCDASDLAQVNSMVSQTLERFGQIDVLVNNAGINQLFATWEMSDEAWESVVKVNLSGTFYCTRAVLPYMIRRSSGSTINLSSIAAYISSKDSGSAYSDAKAGIIGFTKTVAAEVVEYNIRVNVVAPGTIWNEFMARGPALYAEAANNLAPQISMGRLGKPEEVANTIAFLASDETSYISGAVISITGGSHTW